METVVARDRWVRVRYRLYDAQGDAIETGEREWTYLHGGYGSVFPGIEQALEGVGAGESRSVRLEPDDAFGEYDASLVQLRFDDDRWGQTEDMWATPGGMDLRYEAYGTAGHGFVDLLHGHPIRSVTGGDEEGGSNALRYHPVDPHFVKDGHRDMLRHFRDVLVDGVPCESGALEGLRVMQLVDAAYASVRSGRPSRVELTTSL